MTMETTVKHTPGPWAVEHPFNEPGVYVQAKSTALICKLYPADKGYSEEANARLIAAAPHLFYALKRALPWLGKLIAEGVHERCIMPNDAIRTLQLAEAAVSMAEQQQTQVSHSS